MNIPILRHTRVFGLVSAVFVLLMTQFSCQGPPGTPGPPGPSGSSGPPYVWVCTPASYPMAGSNARADLYVFNGSTSTANVAVHILDKNGTNLAGVTIPGSSPPVSYPGQTGSATVPINAANTFIVKWVFPQDSPEGGPNVSTAGWSLTSPSQLAQTSNGAASNLFRVACCRSKSPTMTNKMKEASNNSRPLS